MEWTNEMLDRLAAVTAQTASNLQALSREVQITQGMVREVSAEVQTTQALIREVSAEVQTTQALIREVSAEVRDTNNAVDALVGGINTPVEQLAAERVDRQETTKIQAESIRLLINMINRPT